MQLQMFAIKFTLKCTTFKPKRAQIQRLILKLAVQCVTFVNVHRNLSLESYYKIQQSKLSNLILYINKCL